MPCMKKLLFLRTDNKQEPWLWEIRCSTCFVTCAVSAAVFTEAFLYAVISPVFPFSLIDRIGVHPPRVQYWLSILFSMEAVGLLVAAPILGYLSDCTTNRRGPLLWGIVVLTGAHIMLCLARTLPVLIVGRLLQGVSAGAVWCVGLALLADTVGSNCVGQAMGYVTLAYSIAALLAPLLGGVLYERAGYYAVFGIGAGMVVIDLCFRLLLIEKKSAQRWISGKRSVNDLLSTNRKQEVVSHTQRSEHAAKCGSTMHSSSKCSNNSSVSSTRLVPREPSDSEHSSSSSLVSSVTSKRQTRVAFFVLLKSRRMQATFLANILNAMILTGFDVTLPLFLEETFGWGPLKAGLSFLALLSPSFIQPLYGWIVDRYGSKWPAIVGILTSVTPFACLRFVTYDALSQKVLLCSLLFIIGTGSALALAAIMVEFVHIAKEKERALPGSTSDCVAYAQSYSLFNVSWAIGSLLGSYFAGSIHSLGGWTALGWSYAILCCAVSIPTLMYCGEWNSVICKRLCKRTKAGDKPNTDQ